MKCFDDGIMKFVGQNMAKRTEDIGWLSQQIQVCSKYL